MAKAHVRTLVVGRIDSVHKTKMGVVLGVRRSYILHIRNANSFALQSAIFTHFKKTLVFCSIIYTLIWLMGSQSFANPLAGRQSWIKRMQVLLFIATYLAQCQTLAAELKTQSTRQLPSLGQARAVELDSRDEARTIARFPPTSSQNQILQRWTNCRPTVPTVTRIAFLRTQSDKALFIKDGTSGTHRTRTPVI
jgi:hypothetical protein